MITVVKTQYSYEKMDSPSTTSSHGRRPSKIFIFLASSTLLLAVILFPIGVAAFTFTASYPAGMFYTSFMLAASGVYNFVCLFLRLFYDDSDIIKRHRMKISIISSTLSCLCFVACLIGAIMDIIAAYLLQRTDFDQCTYTSVTTTTSCPSPLCSNLTLPARTCYCCYLYDSRTEGGCNSPMYLARQTYFSGVDSCSDITTILQPLLSAMGGINLLAAIVSMVYVFQTNAIVYTDEEEDPAAVANKQHRGNHTDKILHWIKMVINCLLCRTTTKETTETEMATRDDHNMTNENC